MSAFSQQNLRRNHGLLASADDQAFFAMMIAGMAYKMARKQAARGYSPEDSARWAAQVAPFQFWFILGTFWSFVFVSVFGLGLSEQFPVLGYWAIGQVAFMIFFFVRLMHLRHTPPNKQLVYPFWWKTPVIFVLMLAWPVVSIGGYLIDSGVSHERVIVTNPAAAAAANANSLSGSCVPTPANPHYHNCTDAEIRAIAAYNAEHQR